MKHLFVVLAMVFAGLAESTTALAQWADKDIAVYYLLTPSASPKRDQSVQFYPINQGSSPIDEFEARVYKNGQLLFTEDVHQTVVPNDWDSDPVRLKNTVHMEYEEEADIKLELIMEGDEVPNNNSTTMHVVMPRTMPYPFTWTEDNRQVNFHDGGFGSLDWKFDTYWGAYYMSDRSTNWMGTLISDVLEFPEGEAVKCSFEFATYGGDVTLYFTKDYGDYEFETDTVVVGQSTEDFTSTYYTFRAKGPAIMHITAALGGDWMASGSIYLRNICFSQAQKDLIAKKILQPNGQACVVGSEVKVAARFYNPSTDDIVNPTFCYDAGFGTVTETYQGTIASGETLDYTFEQGYIVDEPSEHQLKVWCVVEGDSDKDNDSLERMITYYKAVAFPYATCFDEEDTNLWTPVDTNGDGQTFDFMPMANNDMAATFYNYAALDINDALISPVMNIPAGKHRVDFNFACYNEQGDVNLKLYITNPEGEMQELFDRDLDSQWWQTGYHLFDVPEEGLYQFTFVAKGKQDAVVIDNFKVDDGEDLGITNVAFGTKSGFNLQPTTVTVSYANFGLSPQRDVLLGYSINNQEMVEEISTIEVLPGDTVSYTFNTLADISQVNMVYDLQAMILDKCGDEDINDFGLAPLLYNNQPKQIPYHQNFNNEDDMSSWELTSNLDPMFSGWSHSFMSGSYSTMGVLQHANWDEQQADSWAFSEGVEMQKGRYEVSYFHHESEWFDGEDYEQSFEVKMGREASAEGMTIDIDKKENVDVCFGPYEKIVRVVDIPEDGIYYLGFHCTSHTGMGYLAIDDVSIEALTEGKALPFVADFSEEGLQDWTFYNPNDWNYLQWKTDEGVLVANRTYDDQWTDPEGMVVAPKLHLDANSTVNVTVGYSVDCTDHKLTLALYAGNENNHGTMTTVKELPISKNEIEYTYTMETGSEPQDIYLGLRTNTKLDGTQDYSYGPYYTVTITSFKVEYDGTVEGIEQLQDEATSDAHAYNLQGQRVGSNYRGIVIKNGKKSIVR
ncbi:MAG: hypothetical protein Q4D33_04565 [Prevotellaceae bacterium]|nr:hypothetical protein [Prevotellaceae bacterium]